MKTATETRGGEPVILVVDAGAADLRLVGDALQRAVARRGTVTLATSPAAPRARFTGRCGCRG